MDVFVGLDVETVSSTSGICEFAAVALDADGREVGRFVELVNPGPVHWNSNACEVHGIKPDDVADGPLFMEVWSKFEVWFASFGDKSVGLFAHNARFEKQVIGADLDGRSHSMEIGCTLALARERLSLPKYTLPVVCKALGVELIHHHRAEPDARAAAMLAFLLCQEELQVFTCSDEVLEKNADSTSGTRGKTWTANSDRGSNPELLANVKQIGSVLEGHRVVITGQFTNGIKKKEGKELVVEYGGKPLDAVSRNATLLVLAGVVSDVREEDLRSSKARRARELGIEVISETEFFKRIRQDS